MGTFQKRKKVTYVKRCLNERCEHKEHCEHGKAQIRFLQHFPNGIKEIPLNMLSSFESIYPVKNCSRRLLSREQCIENQNKAT